jgi:hypothetical protein
MLWVLGGVMLKFAQYIGDVPRHGNVACSFVIIPFQRHAGVYCRGPVSCEFISSQKGVPEMLCMVLAEVFYCEIVNRECERDRASFV